jgi:hypothetical protein
MSGAAKDIMPGAFECRTPLYASPRSDLISFFASSGEPVSGAGATGGFDLQPIRSPRAIPDAANATQRVGSMGAMI